MSADLNGLGKKAASAAKWSVLTQAISKLISPLTTVVLARLLSPEAFGVVATATMVISLATMFSDAGFQKYLIQHEFKCEEELSLCASVAFWSNLAISLGIVIVIVVFQDPLSEMVGNAGMGNVLVVSSLSIPLTAVASVQTALYQREFDFKVLFQSGVGSGLLNMVISVTLAAVGCGYWAMIAGTIVSNVFLAIWLTVQSPWRPRFCYSVSTLKSMLSYGLWILIESVATWINAWAGTFVIGNQMSEWYVGLYKTSGSVSASVVGIFTASLLPIVFSALSRVQEDEISFRRVFSVMQRYLAMCLVPVAVSVFVYRKLVTIVLLGEQWMEAELYMGLWTLAGCLAVVFGYVCSEAYRAKGRPKLCVLVQVLYLAPFLPALLWSCSQGFLVLSIAMPCVRLLLPAINVSVARLTLGLSPEKMLSSTWRYFVLSLVAVLPGIISSLLTDSLPVQWMALFVTIVLYVVLLFSVKRTRGDAIGLLDNLGIGKVVPAFLR